MSSHHDHPWPCPGFYIGNHAPIRVGTWDCICPAPTPEVEAGERERFKQTCYCAIHGTDLTTCAPSQSPQGSELGDGAVVPRLTEDERDGLCICEWWRVAPQYETHSAACSKNAAAVETIVAQREAAAVKAAADLAALLACGPRFWSKVDVGRKHECWKWLGGSSIGGGYGGFQSPAGRVAHRYAWAVANGRLPGEGLVIRHRCDNPACCNPNHLEEGTQQDNVTDMIERGRAAYASETCKYGHPWTSETTHIRRNTGERRCLVCARAYEAARRAAYEMYPCPECGKEFILDSTVRHVRRVHQMAITPAEVRDRANRGEGGRA